MTISAGGAVRTRRTAYLDTIVLFNDKSTQTNSPIITIDDEPVIIRAHALAAGESANVELVDGEGEGQYFTPYQRNGCQLKLTRKCNQIILAVPGRYRLVLNGTPGASYIVYCRGASMTHEYLLAELNNMSCNEITGGEIADAISTSVPAQTTIANIFQDCSGTPLTPGAKLVTCNNEGALEIQLKDCGGNNLASGDAVVSCEEFESVMDEVAGTLGAGAAFADGNLQRPQYVVGENTFDNVGDALHAVADAETASYKDCFNEPLANGSNIPSCEHFADVSSALAGALGAGAAYNNNAVTPPQYVVNGQTYNNVGAALQGASYSLLDCNSTAVASGSAVVTCAENANQLHDISTMLGGDAQISQVGESQSPQYVINGNTYGNVGAALAALGNVPFVALDDPNGSFGYPVAVSDGAAAGGYGARAIQVNSIALGLDANVNGLGGIAIGADATIPATSDGSIAIGANATASDVHNVAIGDASTASGTPIPTPAISINDAPYQFAGSSPIGTVSLGSPNNDRTLTNVAAGQVNASSTDAINGSQLYTVIQAVELSAPTNGEFTVAQDTSDPSLPTASYGGRDAFLGTPDLALRIVINGRVAVAPLYWSE